MEVAIDRLALAVGLGIVGGYTAIYFLILFWV